MFVFLISILLACSNSNAVSLTSERSTLEKDMLQEGYFFMACGSSSYYHLLYNLLGSMMIFQDDNRMIAIMADNITMAHALFGKSKFPRVMFFIHFNFSYWEQKLELPLSRHGKHFMFGVTRFSMYYLTPFRYTIHVVSTCRSQQQQGHSVSIPS